VLKALAGVGVASGLGRFHQVECGPSGKPCEGRPKGLPYRRVKNARLAEPDVRKEKNSPGGFHAGRLASLSPNARNRASSRHKDQRGIARFGEIRTPPPEKRSRAVHTANLELRTLVAGLHPADNRDPPVLRNANPDPPADRHRRHEFGALQGAAAVVRNASYDLFL